MEDKLKQALKEIATDGRITCEDVWQFADDNGITKSEMGKACDDLGIRINSCQLGCF